MTVQPRTDEIEPLVPRLPRPARTDGGRDVRPRRDGRKTFDDSEAEAPLVPDLR